VHPTKPRSAATARAAVGRVLVTLPWSQPAPRARHGLRAPTLGSHR
jgi:hypothetical protein